MVLRFELYWWLIVILGILKFNFVLSNDFLVKFFLLFIVLFKMMLFKRDIIFGYWFVKWLNKGFSNDLGFKCFNWLLYLLKVICFVVIIIGCFIFIIFY